MRTTFPRLYCSRNEANFKPRLGEVGFLLPGKEIAIQIVKVLPLDAA